MPLLHGDLFLPEIALALIGAMAFITVMKIFTRSLTESEGRIDDGVNPGQIM